VGRSSAVLPLLIGCLAGIAIASGLTPVTDSIAMRCTIWDLGTGDQTEVWIDRLDGTSTAWQGFVISTTNQ